MQKWQKVLCRNLSKTVVANGSSSRVIADIVLKAVMTEKLQWRYLEGADAERLFETKTKMSDIEFEKFLYELFGLWPMIIFIIRL